MYIAYLDEFGHIGPFTGRGQEKYNENPMFGLGGIVLHATAVRVCDLVLSVEIESSCLGDQALRRGRLYVGKERRSAPHHCQHSQVQGAPHGNEPDIQSN